MTNRCVYIALMTDNNYVMPTEVLLKSMYENKKQETIYKIFILCDSLKNNNMVEKLREMTQGNFYVETIKVDNPCKNFINNSNPLMTNTTFLKFEIASILKNYDKILYIDVDTIVLQDLLELYNIDLKNTYAGVVKDYHVSYFYDSENFIDINDYFNAGVLLLNTKKIREENLNKLMADYYVKNNTKLMFHDQSVMNKIFNNNITIISPKYNWINSYTDYSDKKLELFFGITNINSLKKDLCIIHYCRFKPWKYKNFKFSNLWLKYYLDLNYNIKNLNLKTCYLSSIYCLIRGRFKLRKLDDFIRKIRYYNYKKNNKITKL